MKRAFVTGGWGFLGKRLIAELADRRGVEVRALARSEASAIAKEIPNQHLRSYSGSGIQG